ncbi:MAG TPA: Gfo/Idh/MocA family oxidoreductase [Fervidobacterium sp.]|nr:Gfo/Idh/MocA family oxidoreductase [Fervidobacterium sp.]HPT54074.1 Gfo/Idh/MocA family oxidoreductase [Fervidobacterium sp.]HPZ17171.1 Gfo/Idh/MocA family oxidoreductase [Fervidobacterium sp.]HQE48240.1 Gfo/Idh/MocA family oxidoreductase [Fervidobacterium sp.]HUM41920.1 Gfo/Idh/MocA family oxidoreductase [Fervidobacterium sp.]
MKKLKMGLIGCGRIGSTKHIEAIARNIDVIELTAVCDLVINKAKTCSEKVEQIMGIKTKCYTDYIKMIEDEELDFVAITTESGYHYEIAIEALKRNKHVLVEKPMALSTTHIDQMCSLSREKNLRLGVCFQNRFNPPIVELRKKIDSGAFGRVNYAVANVRWNRDEEYYKQASWRGTWHLDGGSLMNQCTHNIDLLQWMLGGEVEEVYGIIRNFQHPYIEAEDFGGALIKFKGGSVGILEGTSTVYPKNLEETLSIFGELGTVIIGGLAVNKIQVWKFPDEDSHPFMELPDPDTVYGFGHVPLYRDFYESIVDDKKPKISGEDGRKAVEIVLAIYKSALEGRPVKFPFEFSTEMMKDWSDHYVMRC